MPKLELVSLREARLELSLKGKRGALMRQYMDFIGRLETGRAGKLIPEEGETTAALRRRLGAAAELLGKSLAVNRQGNAVYFWEQETGRSPVRRRRRRTANTPSED